MPIKKWREFVLEYVNYNKIYDIAIELSNFIDYERMYVLRNVNNPKIFNVIDNKLVPSNSVIYKQDNLIRNYKTYFNNIEVKNSEIIKIEYSNYNWIIIFLAYGKNHNYSVVSYSPDFNIDFDENNYKFLEIVNNYLESKNFQVLKNKLSVQKISNNFLNQIIKIFRDISGRSYSKHILSEIKKDFEDFKNENPNEWKLYERWKYKNLGKSLKCVRFMDLPSTFSVKLVDGGMKPIKELKSDDMFYYPISGRDFSQWSEIDATENIDDIKKDLIGGILSSGNVGFISNIPTKNIILTNKLMLYNFSPNVYEREVVVEHNTSESYDKNIICKKI